MMKRSKFEQAELRRLNQELDQLGRTIARTLVVKGPEGVNTLGPQVIRFRETEAELTACPVASGARFRTHTKLRTRSFSVIERHRPAVKLARAVARFDQVCRGFAVLQPAIPSREPPRFQARDDHGRRDGVGGVRRAASTVSNSNQTSSR